MKLISEMNVKELKKYIRKLTNKSNKTLERINKKGTISKAVEQEINVLKTKGIIGKRNKVILGFKNKNKSELISQARELEYFTQWKGTETKEVRDKTNYSKYQSFIKNNKEFSDYTYQEWRDLVETLGTMDSFVNSFGYENLKELHREATEKNRNINLADAMRKTIKEVKGQQKTREDAIDILRGYIFNDTL